MKKKILLIILAIVVPIIHGYGPACFYQTPPSRAEAAVLPPGVLFDFPFTIGTASDVTWQGGAVTWQGGAVTW
jgi:hypothetical protein